MVIKGNTVKYFLLKDTLETATEIFEKMVVKESIAEVVC